MDHTKCPNDGEPMHFFSKRIPIFGLFDPNDLVECNWETWEQDHLGYLVAVCLKCDYILSVGPPEEEFPVAIQPGGRIVVPLEYLQRLHLGQGTLVRVNIRKDMSEETEEFLANICQGGRITVPLRYRQILGLKQGTRVRFNISIWPETPKEVV